eukprot:GHVP01042940.1.p1 GENE.GHVP01042940.1~~GHVP01042940.1.p1  ORF type:complete len:756 (-),score=106.32 GHVP01042940.1:42-2309(-)
MKSFYVIGAIWKISEKVYYCVNNPERIIFIPRAKYKNIIRDVAEKEGAFTIEKYKKQKDVDKDDNVCPVCLDDKKNDDIIFITCNRNHFVCMTCFEEIKDTRTSCWCRREDSCMRDSANISDSIKEGVLDTVSNSEIQSSSKKVIFSKKSKESRIINISDGDFINVVEEENFTEKKVLFLLKYSFLLLTNCNLIEEVKKRNVKFEYLQTMEIEKKKKSILGKSSCIHERTYLPIEKNILGYQGTVGNLISELKKTRISPGYLLVNQTQENEPIEDLVTLICEKINASSPKIRKAQAKYIYNKVEEIEKICFVMCSFEEFIKVPVSFHRDYTILFLLNNGPVENIFLSCKTFNMGMGILKKYEPIRYNLKVFKDEGWIVDDIKTIIVEGYQEGVFERYENYFKYFDKLKEIRIIIHDDIQKGSVIEILKCLNGVDKTVISFHHNEALYKAIIDFIESKTMINGCFDLLLKNDTDETVFECIVKSSVIKKFYFYSKKELTDVDLLENIVFFASEAEDISLEGYGALILLATESITFRDINSMQLKLLNEEIDMYSLYEKEGKGTTINSVQSISIIGSSILFLDFINILEIDSLKKLSIDIGTSVLPCHLENDNRMKEISSKVAKMRGCTHLTLYEEACCFIPSLKNQNRKRGVVFMDSTNIANLKNIRRLSISSIDYGDIESLTLSNFAILFLIHLKLKRMHVFDSLTLNCKSKRMEKDVLKYFGDSEIINVGKVKKINFNKSSKLKKNIIWWKFIS